MFCSFLIGSEAKLQFNFLGYFLGLLILCSILQISPGPRLLSITILSASRRSSIALHNAGAIRIEVHQLAEHRKAAVKRAIFRERTDYRRHFDSDNLPLAIVCTGPRFKTLVSCI